MTQPVRVALVSASPLVRAGLRVGLAASPGLAPTSSDFDSLAAARAAGFDGALVAVVDCDPEEDDAPAPDGAAGDPEAEPALVLLASGEGGAAAEWLAAGHSVLARHAPIAQIAAAIQATALGLVVGDRAWATNALDAGADAGRRAAAMGLEALTPREHEVLLRMSEGLGNRAIAQQLRISPHTAKFHVAQVIAKLSASSRAHAVAKALRAGLVEL